MKSRAHAQKRAVISDKFIILKTKEAELISEIEDCNDHIAYLKIARKTTAYDDAKVAFTKSLEVDALALVTLEAELEKTQRAVHQYALALRFLAKPGREL